MCIRDSPSVVCLSSVAFVHSVRRFKFSAIFLRRWSPWPSVDVHRKLYGDRSRWTPPSGELNPRGVANIAILGLSKAISRKRCKIGDKLLLITDRKSYMSFRLMPKWVTLDDLERRNGRFCVISANLIAFGEHCVKAFEYIPNLSTTEM